MAELLRKLKFLLRRDEFERDMDEEMRHHLAMKAEDHGSAEAARRQFGNVTLLKENSRAMWTWTFWEQLAQDLRYGLRMMAANPLFTAMAALSLALGIGANTAIYSFMDAVLLRSLPVRHPEELVVFNWHSKDAPAVMHGMNGSNYRDAKMGYGSPNFPFAAFELFRATHDVFSTVFAFQNGGRLNLIIQGRAEVADVQFVSGGYYSGLGIVPAAGRLTGDDDDRPGATHVVVVSHSYWQRRFAANPAAVGQTILVNNIAFTIAGVTAPEFHGISPGTDPALYIPMHAAPLLILTRPGRPDTRFIDKNFFWVEMMGRLRPGISLAQAQAALAAPFHQLVASAAVTDKEKRDLPALIIQEGSTGLDSLRRQFSKPLLVLMTLVGMILAIACANIANLLLARASSRRREMAVRLSLGAGRARVVRQLLTESLLLASIGGLLGVFFAFWGVRFLSVLMAGGRDNFSLNTGLNWHVLGFTLALSLATGVLFGLAPALQATRIDLTPALKETSSGALRSRVRRSLIRVNLSQSLVVVQVALSLLLLIAAGLFVRTLSNLHSVELGFNRENLLLFSMNAKQAGYKDAALAKFYDDLQNRLSAIPGVRGVSLSSFPLVSGGFLMRGFKISNAVKTANKPVNPSMLSVGPHFFTTMQIPILLGREIDDRDKPGSPLVAVVNENLVKTYFAGENPIGKRFGFAFGDPTAVEIVGVARNARYNSVKQDIPPVVYTPYGQELPALSHMSFELRTAGDPLAMVNTVHNIVQEADARVPVTDIRTQARQIDQTLSQERVFAQLCTCFAFLALAIACVGLYGTMAYTVARRTSEIGIRMALGAERRRIVWMVLREVFVLAAIGLAVGLPTAYATTKFVKSFLFGMQPNDPLAVSLAVALLLIAAIVAGYAPARHASKIDPMTALRHE